MAIEENGRVQVVEFHWYETEIFKFQYPIIAVIVVISSLTYK